MSFNWNNPQDQANLRKQPFYAEYTPPKNLVNFHFYEEGPQRWTTLDGRSWETILRSWGYIEWYVCSKDAAIIHFMAKFSEDGNWRYGHAVSTSVYMDEKVQIKAETGIKAEFEWRRIGLSQAVDHAQQRLNEVRANYAKHMAAEPK